ncbi:MAG: hypothetical protein DRJ68_05845 [Thermoprotei archaeon]|nr:MAG: hypothetical protein DRJ68_05845 [Thermoprotei archaeon]
MKSPSEFEVRAIEDLASLASRGGSAVSGFDGDVKCRVTLQGVSRSFSFTGSYEHVKLGEKTLREAVETFNKLPKHYPKPHAFFSDADVCPIHMLIESNGAVLSISMMEEEEYRITGVLKSTSLRGLSIKVSSKATTNAVIEAIERFYLDPNYLKSVHDKSLKIVRDVESRIRLLQAEAPELHEERLVTWIPASQASSHWPGLRSYGIPVTKAGLGCIPSSDVVKVVISKSLFNSSLKIEYYNREMRRVEEVKLRLSDRKRMPMYLDALKKCLPGRVEVR